MQSFIQASYYAKLLVLPPIPLPSVAMDALRLLISVYPGMTDRFKIAGFDPNSMGCSIIGYVANETYSNVPILNIDPTNGFDFYG